MKAYVVQFKCCKDESNVGRHWFGTKAAAMKEARRRAKWAAVRVSECDVPTGKGEVIAYLNGAGLVVGQIEHYRPASTAENQSAGFTLTEQVETDPFENPLKSLVGDNRFGYTPLFWNEDGEWDKLVPYGAKRDLT
tara:strand:- start:2425 stop:2832 length:408 start_codon:yes stop_codon:yes gene_type:complete